MGSIIKTLGALFEGHHQHQDDFLESFQKDLSKKFLGFALLICLLVLLRNAFKINLTVLFSMIAFLCIAIILVSKTKSPKNIRRICRVLVIAMLAAMWKAMLVWPEGFPAPPLAYLSLFVVMAAFMDHILTAVLVVGLSALLLWLGVARADVSQVNQIELLTALTIVVVLIFFGCIAFWVLFRGLLRKRWSLTNQIALSRNARQGLISIFRMDLEPALQKLKGLTQSGRIDWDIAQTAVGGLKRALTEGRESLRQFDFDSVHSEGKVLEDLNNVQRQIFLVLLYCGLFACVSIIMVSVLGPGEVALPEIVGLVLSLVLLVFAQQREKNRILRIIGISLFNIIVVWASYNAVHAQTPAWSTLYFIPLIFFAMFLANAPVMLMVGASGLGSLFYWISEAPLSGLAPETMISNIGIALFGIAVFSGYLWAAFKNILREARYEEVHLYEDSLLRDRFAAALFHDMLNPVSVIDGMIQAKNAGLEADPEDDQRLVRMSNKLEGLFEFSENFLSASGDGLNLPLNKIGTEIVCAELKESFMPALAEKNILCEKIGADLSVFAHGPVLTGPVLGALVSNAVRFSPPGGTISMVVSELPGRRVRIRIEDEGPGMSSAMLEEFEKGGVSIFSNATNTAGDGLGLRLAKDYITQMGGKLVLDPPEKGGMAVNVILPMPPLQ